jgi:hypothetical protein
LHRFIGVREMCRMLDISRAQYAKLRRVGKFPIPEAPQALVAATKFRLADVESYITTGDATSWTPPFSPPPKPSSLPSKPN